MSVLKRILGLFITVIVSIIVLACVLELALRVIDPFGRRETAAISQPARSGSSFRNPPQTTPKAKGELRIVALGDSYTWGDGVAEDDGIWPSLLEAKLRAGLKREDINVINLGICGLTTVNELELLIRLGQNFQPDIVVVGYVKNDVLPSGPNLMRMGEEWLSTSKRLNIIADKDLHASLDRRSYLYAFLNYRYLALQRKFSRSRTWDELYSDSAPTWTVTKNAFASFASWSNQKKIPVIFVIFPCNVAGKHTLKDFPDIGLYEKVNRAVVDAGMDVVDLVPVFVDKGRDFRDWMASPVDSHPNRDAHDIAATAIADHILKRKMVG